jgi:NifU-like protein involved in Fe-S cluster formation
MPEEPTNEDRLQEAIRNPQNMGELENADAVGTVGSPDCGDMLRLWVKFKDEDGKRVIDKATFQSFGCQTAIAVASVATEMIKGRTVGEAMALDSETLSGSLGPLPPMKIHCGQLVESALKDALTSGEAGGETETEMGTQASPLSPSLVDAIPAANAEKPTGKLRIVPLEENEDSI